MQNVYLTGAVRTPIGRFYGGIAMLVERVSRTASQWLAWPLRYAERPTSAVEQASDSSGRMAIAGI